LYKTAHKYKNLDFGGFLGKVFFSIPAQKILLNAGGVYPLDTLHT